MDDHLSIDIDMEQQELDDEDKMYGDNILLTLNV